VETDTQGKDQPSDHSESKRLRVLRCEKNAVEGDRFIEIIHRMGDMKSDVEVIA
jgi:hypothetical protein